MLGLFVNCTTFNINEYINEENYNREEEGEASTDY